jgi:peroxiredoxin
MTKRALRGAEKFIVLTILVLAGVFGTAALALADGGPTPGTTAPAFTLKNVDGNMVSLADYASKKAVVVVITCNHCPYAQAYQNRLISLQNEYASKDVQFVLINPNDAVKQPQDSYDNMQKRAKEKNYPFPYLHDESQQVAKAYGANRTPEAYLIVNNKVVYRGRIDDNTEEAQVKQRDLKDAIDKVLAGTPDQIETAMTKAFGCTIKWR